MYDKLKEIVCDGIEYYYNTGKYLFVFDTPEGGTIWIFKITTSETLDCNALPFEILDEFILFVNFIKNLK